MRSWLKVKAWNNWIWMGLKEFGSECETCMYWWNEKNITAELPDL